MEVEMENVQGLSGKDIVFLLNQNDSWEIEEDLTTSYGCDVETYLQSISHNEVIKVEEMETSEENENTSLSLDVIGRVSVLYAQKKENLVRGRNTTKGSGINQTEFKTLFCFQCKKSFQFESNLNPQVLSGAALKLLSCIDCVIKFQRKQQLSQHNNMHPTGGQSFLRKGDLNPSIVEGRQRFPEEDNFKEDISSLSYRCFAQKSHLIKHQKFICNKLRPFCCDKCRNTFAYKSELNLHISSHSEEKLFYCDQCGNSFQEKAGLVRHQMSFHNELFCCDKCRKTFVFESELNMHKLSHSEEKLFHCDQCRKSFTQKARLVRHQRLIHDKLRLFPCGECEKTFRCKSHLTKHKLYHNEMSFSCDKCGDLFSLKCNLVLHQKYTHGKLKPFSCDECEKTFRHKGHLNQHKLMHSDLKSACQKCNKIFKLSYLKKHEALCSHNVAIKHLQGHETNINL